jgi:C1A family cysteine protease
MARSTRVTVLALLLIALSSAHIITQPARAQKSEEERIAELNRQIRERGESWVAGPTTVGRLSAEEKKKRLGLLPLTEEMLSRVPVYSPPAEAALQLPSAFDWRPLNGTTPAKSQGGCGSCWAFAATGQLEAHIRIYDGRIDDLSEQQVIDCNDEGAGCQGGWLFAAYDVFRDSGAVYESCIPYEARDDLPCRHSQCEVVAHLSDYQYIPNNVNQIKSAVYNHGPVATGMTALDNLYNYSSGCYDTETTQNPNHAVLIVGWDDDMCSGAGAWIIKNSWGEDWGQNGFGYIKYGVCNIGYGTYTIDYIPSTVFVELHSPDGGEILDVGDQHLIEWTTSRETPDSLSILLSLDSGANYDYTVATGLIGVSSHDWTVPNLPVKTARIKVIAYFGGEIAGYDASADDFTIRGAPYRYVSPAGSNIYPYSIPDWAANHIQDAIDAADSDDTIAVAAATYSQAATVDVPVVLMGGWNADFTVWDPGAHVSTIQIYMGSCVSFMNVTGYCGITGFTLRNGIGRSAQLPVLALYGGGVFSYNSSPVIEGNVIDNCGSATEGDFSGGGGITCYGGTPTIENNELTGCHAQSGGGIYLYLTSATIRGNRITGSAPNDLFSGTKAGGGVYANHATAILEDNVITENDGYTQGGGAYGRLSTMSIEGDSITGHDCSDAGGGVYSLRSSLTISNAVITGNTSTSSGGGIYHKAERIDIANSIIGLNDASLFGGGINADSSWGGIVNNAIDRNTAVYTGGNLFILSSVGLDIRNNMITYGGGDGLYTGSPAGMTLQYNNLYGNTPSDVSGITLDSTNTYLDPLYADTTSLDYHLLVHSCGIDGGDPAGGTDPDGSRADQGAFGGPGAVTAAPEYIKNLSASAAGDTTIRLEWDPPIPGGLDYYAIYGDTTDGFAPNAAVFLGTAPTTQDTFLHHPVAGCRYYRVSAVNTDGYGGGYSNQGAACVAGADLIIPTVTVTYPNGGEKIGIGDTVNIEWIATDNRTVDSVSIYLSPDGGGLYDLVAHGEPNDSIYEWIVPSVVSDSCLIRVIAYDPGLLTGEDTSDSLFSLKDYTSVGDITDDDGRDVPRYANSLEQNYPNPFNGTTTIRYSVAEPCRVEIRLFNPAGQLVRTIEARHRKAGQYEVVWNGRDNTGRGVSSGVYFVRLKAGKFKDTRKIIYLR